MFGFILGIEISMKKDDDEFVMKTTLVAMEGETYSVTMIDDLVSIQKRHGKGNMHTLKVGDHWEYRDEQSGALNRAGIELSTFSEKIARNAH